MQNKKNIVFLFYLFGITALIFSSCQAMDRHLYVIPEEEPSIHISSLTKDPTTATSKSEPTYSTGSATSSSLHAASTPTILPIFQKNYPIECIKPNVYHAIGKIKLTEALFSPSAVNMQNCYIVATNMFANSATAYFKQDDIPHAQENYAYADLARARLSTFHTPTTGHNAELLQELDKKLPAIKQAVEAVTSHKTSTGIPSPSSLELVSSSNTSTSSKSNSTMHTPASTDVHFYTSIGKKKLADAPFCVAMAEKQRCYIVAAKLFAGSAFLYYEKRDIERTKQNYAYADLILNKLCTFDELTVVIDTNIVTLLNALLKRIIKTRK